MRSFPRQRSRFVRTKLASIQKLRSEKGCSQNYLGELQLVRGTGTALRTGAGKNGSGSSSGSSTGNGSKSSTGSTVAHEGDSAQHTRPSRPTAQATAGEAMDLDGITTAAGAVAPPGANTHGPAAEALLEEAV